MKRIPKHYFHRRETVTITRLAEYMVEAESEVEARAILQRNPDSHPSDRPGSATMAAIVERQLGELRSGRNDQQEKSA